MSDLLDLIPAYRNNLFVRACGPIRSIEELTESMLNLPELPTGLNSLSFEVRQHLIPELKHLFIPNGVSIEIARSIDVMLRQGYSRHRAGTIKFPWNRSGNPSNPVPSLMSVVGLSGVGKSKNIERTLQGYDQVVVHESMPGYVGEFTQLTYLKIDVPATGKSKDLFNDLIREMENVLGCITIDDYSASKYQKGSDLSRIWQRLANKYMLGMVVLDEIQNLFKEQTLTQRRKHSKSSPGRMELRLADDETLKMILTAINTWGIPILMAGTMDCLDIFNNRFSTAQRLSLDGHFQVGRFSSADDPFFKTTYFPALCRYQWVQKPIMPSDEFRDVFFDLTGGIPRICTMLWYLAHSYVFQQKRDSLVIQDFEKARTKYLSPLIPAIKSLNTNDVRSLMKYEDLLPRDPNFWNRLW
jgi:hypothetical protein